MRSVGYEKKINKPTHEQKRIQFCFWLCWAQGRITGLFAKGQYRPSTVKLVVKELVPTSLDISKVYSPLSCISVA